MGASVGYWERGAPLESLRNLRCAHGKNVVAFFVEIYLHLLRREYGVSTMKYLGMVDYLQWSQHHTR